MGEKRREEVAEALALEAAKLAKAEREAKATKVLARRQRRRRRIIVGTVAVVVVVLGALVGSNVWVTRSATGHAYDDVDAVPVRTVAIVFGAFVDPDGRPSPMLHDRLQGAIDLFKAGRVRHLLMTGDNSRPEYDEVSAMREQALAAGVPESAITRDYAGFDTYDSCARAATVFGVRDAVLVTQDYHLSRALFLCRAQGIDAVGLSVPDWQHRPEASPTQYPADLQRSYMTREWLARVNAVFEARITKREPRLGGPYEGLRGT